MPTLFPQYSHLKRKYPCGISPSNFMVVSQLRHITDSILCSFKNLIPCSITPIVFHLNACMLVVFVGHRVFLLEKSVEQALWKLQP